MCDDLGVDCLAKRNGGLALGCTVALVLDAVCLISFAQKPADTYAGEAFARMCNLVGNWQVTDGQTSARKAFRISYRLISRDSALVETFGDPAKQTTESIYHRDGEHLMATHYCARGNQPRLRLDESKGSGPLIFRFFDATNLKSEKDSHLVRLRFEFLGGSGLKREEVYAENGREEASVLLLERVR
jgi:hypothetical protein